MPGVGEMRGDLRSHRARAQNGSFFNRYHGGQIILNEYSFSKEAQRPVHRRLALWVRSGLYFLILKEFKRIYETVRLRLHLQPIGCITVRSR